MAISAGIFYCHGDVVAIMDADLQDPPEELQRFLDKWREGYHVVYAIRTKRKEGLVKRASYKIFYRVLHWLGSVEIPVDAGDLCVMDRSVVEVLKAPCLNVPGSCGGSVAGRVFGRSAWLPSVLHGTQAHRNTRSQNCFD